MDHVVHNRVGVRFESRRLLKASEEEMIPAILDSTFNLFEKHLTMEHHATIDRSSTRFALENEQGQEMGYLNYHVDDAYYFLDYVYVNPLFRGQSIGQQIVRVALERAQSEHLKAVPICGYARTVMQRMASRA